MTCPKCKREPVATIDGNVFLDGLCGGCWAKKIFKEKESKDAQG